MKWTVKYLLNGVRVRTRHDPFERRQHALALAATFGEEQEARVVRLKRKRNAPPAKRVLDYRISDPISHWLALKRDVARWLEESGSNGYSVCVILEELEP